MLPLLRLLSVPLLVLGLALLLGPGPDEGQAAAAGRDLPRATPNAPLLAATGVGPPPARLAGRGAPPRPPSPAPVAGPAVVTVLGPDGPRQGVGIDVFGLGACGHGWKRTDDAGQIHLESIPYDGTVRVLVDAPPLAADGAARATASLRGPETVIETGGSMPLVVTFQDAETGEGLSDVPFAIGGEAWGSLRTEPRRVAQTRPGDRIRVDVRTQAPSGLVAFDGLEASATVSRRARGLRLTATFRHEARVFLRAVDVDGRVVSDADVAAAEVAGQVVRGRIQGETAGDLRRVRGVPFLRRERIRLLATRPTPGDASVDEQMVEETEQEVWESAADDDEDLHPDDTWSGCWGLEPGFGAIAVGRFPPRIEDPLVLTAVFDPARPVRDIGLGCSFGCSHGDYMQVRGPRGDVEVQAFDADGEPLQGVRLELRGRWVRTDVAGRARFRDVPAGERSIRLEEPGWVRTKHTLVVVGGRTNHTVLREDVGGELLVRVLGDDGRPLTGARLEVPDHLAWADVEDGVQRLDVATDHRGERLLRRFPAGRARISVRWGRRRGHGEVEVQSGTETTLEIRLSPAP